MATGKTLLPCRAIDPPSHRRRGCRGWKPWRAWPRCGGPVGKEEEDERRAGCMRKGGIERWNACLHRDGGQAAGGLEGEGHIVNLKGDFLVIVRPKYPIF